MQPNVRHTIVKQLDSFFIFATTTYERNDTNVGKEYKNEMTTEVCYHGILYCNKKNYGNVQKFSALPWKLAGQSLVFHFDKDF